ncbi:MAG TPA: hypothetical protein PKC29_08575 [Thermodesulfobacteriota bacterium]|nr:hypothetical protein [Thermodesulfobacteriota bacterium]
MELFSRLAGSALFSAVFIFLVSFALYSPSLKHDFVWDDVEVIAKSNVSFDPSNIAGVVVPGVEKNKKERYYRPVVYASMVLDNDLWGVSPFGFHLSNLLANAVAAVLFYFAALLVLRELWGGGGGAAFLSALLFALYPMHVESVSWIAGRTDVLCAVFFFLAFIAHILSYRNLLFLIAAALSFSLALMSKEVAAAFPFLALGYDLIARRPGRKSNVLRYAVYAGLLLLYLYLRGRAFSNIPEISASVAGEATAAAGALGVYLEHIKTILGAYMLYINKLVFPFDFNAFIASIPHGAVYVASAVVVTAALALLSAVSVIKKENVSAFCIFWILLTLGPSAIISIFGIASTPAAERYLYIPSAGFCLILGYWVFRAAEHRRYRPAAVAAAVILVALYAFFTYQRQAVWADDLLLWGDAAVKSPGHPLPHSNYGLALSAAGDSEGALREYMIALSPEMNDGARGKAVTANNVGLEYLRMERYPEAEKWFRRALEFDMGYGRTYYHLGLINYIKADVTGSPESLADAEMYLKKVFEHYYTFGRANLVLAKVYLKKGERGKAVGEAKTAIKSGLPPALLKEAEEIVVVNDNGGENEP